MKLLFVCLGNICRSPMAEGVMKKLCAERNLKWDIDSAGLIDYHEGEQPDSRMITAAKRRGYTLSHRSRPVRQSDFDTFDLVIGMDGNNIRRLQSISPSNCKNKIRIISDFFVDIQGYSTVPDPYYGDMSDFDNVITLLEDACLGILKEYAE